MRKATPVKKAEIRKLRADGLTRDEIADRVQLSAGTVSAVLREQAPVPVAQSAAPPTPPDEALPDEPPEPLTRAGLRAVLQTHLAALQTMAQSARADNNASGEAMARRMITALVPAIARVTPDDPADDPDNLVIARADIDREALAVRALLRDRLAKALARRAEASP